MVSKKTKKKKPMLPYRLNILFVLVFILFSVLILRLGVIQIVQGEQFLNQVERSKEVVIKNTVPRGKMYDRNGFLLVDNSPSYTITYTKMKVHTSQYETLELALKLNEFMDIDTKRITERDKKDYWIITRKEKALNKLSEEEKISLSNNDAYYKMLNRITDKDLGELTEEELSIIAIKRELDFGYAYAPQIVKNNATFEEVAIISEHLAELPGVDIQMHAEGDEREITFINGLAPFYGQVSPIPVNYADYYQVRGYNRNDLVGSSFLEQYYEDVLRGQKGEEVYLVDKAGVVLEKKGTIAGKRGLDLVLTFDLQLQNEIEKIVEEELIKGMANPKNPYLNSAYVVMMDPNTGEVLSLVGKKFVEDGFTNKALDTITKSFEMGSAIKGATMLTGYETGVIKPGQYIIDAPIVFRDANKTEKKSHKTMGRINDYTALEWSSNVYMFKIAMKIAQYDLENNTQVLSNQQAYQIMRNLFSQFGLGVKTEIDLPMEATGYEGPISNVTKLMDLAIGQYDTYTPLQMGQYISTIANSGYRMKPYLVKAIKEVNPQKDYEKIIYETKPKVLNKIPMDQELIKRVQHGFWLVMHGDPKRATARSFFVDKPYNPAGKTGTAEVYVRDDDSGAYLRNEEDELIESVNSTLVGYAPYENPEIAFVVIVPYAESGAVSKFIGSRVLDAYFNYQPTKEQ